MFKQVAEIKIKLITNYNKYNTNISLAVLGLKLAFALYLSIYLYLSLLFGLDSHLQFSTNLSYEK